MAGIRLHPARTTFRAGLALVAVPPSHHLLDPACGDHHAGAGLGEQRSRPVSEQCPAGKQEPVFQEEQRLSGEVGTCAADST